MNRIEHGVRLGWTAKGNQEDYAGRDVRLHGYYAGRDKNKIVKISQSPNIATMMSKEVAEKLVHKLKQKYPLSEVIELICNERDEAAATSLAELGEASTSVTVLQDAIKECLADGMSREDMLKLLERTENSIVN